MSFNVIPPLALTSAMVISSTVAEPDAGEQVHSMATNYALDAEVISTTTHRKFKSLLANNVGNALPVWPETKTLWWYDVGPTNRWAMLDLLQNTATVKASGDLTIVLAPGARVDSLALRGLVATALAVTMTVPQGAGQELVYSTTRNLNRRLARNAYEYCFNDFETQASVTLIDLPPFANGRITVTLSNSSGAVQCGSLVVGKRVELGRMVADPESDVLNFSTIEREKDGTARLEPQRNAPTLVSQILCPKSSVNAIRQLRDQVNARPAIWSGISNDLDGYAEAVDICGIYKKFSINLRHTEHAVVSLQLEQI